MDNWRPTLMERLIVRCQATRMHSAELLERSEVLEHQIRETMRRIREDKARRHGKASAVPAAEPSQQVSLLCQITA